MIAYIGIGSNEVENPVWNWKNCQEAIQHLMGSEENFIRTQASYYYTQPVGVDSPHWYMNSVLALECYMTLRGLFEFLCQIEQELGKGNPAPGEARKIDMDILLFGDQVIQEPDLIIPHPRMHLRRFVLKPLSEIAPGLVHPLLKKTIEQLLEELDDPHRVDLFDPRTFLYT
jgi:2-amino-4-hydroxy-6-hydroxymethyldihydropteridine diphosphokinase